MPRHVGELKLELLPSSQAADEVARHTRKLAEFTQQAAAALGAYQGGNIAVREAHRLRLGVETIIMLYATESALMAALRLYALFDSDPRMVSYQRINRNLKRGEVSNELLKRSPSNYVSREVALDLISSFQRNYADLNWSAHGKLMRLRNIGLAHLTETELKHSLSYDELRQLTQTACLLCSDLDLLARGHNNGARDWLELRTSQAYAFWARHVKLLHGVDLPDLTSISSVNS